MISCFYHPPPPLLVPLLVLVLVFGLHTPAIAATATATTTTSTARNLLVNGADTLPDEYPFHVQVGGCSGALIAPNIVITAGHVVPSEEGAIGMTVRVDAYQTENDPNSTIRTVEKAIIHPKYDTMHYDFVILILDGPAAVKPIRINRSPTVPTASQNVTLLGTGTATLAGTEGRPKVLQKTTTYYVPTDDCGEAYDPERSIRYNGNFLDGTSLCTMGNDGDGCVYDSGGPVIIEERPSKKKGPTLVGLISFGIDCNDPVYPAVNARISSVSLWIDNIVCQYSTYPPPKDFHCDTTNTTTTTATATATNMIVDSTDTTPPPPPPHLQQTISPSSLSTTTIAVPTTTATTTSSTSHLVMYITIGAGAAVVVLVSLLRWKKASSNVGEQQYLLSK
jgi:trypsin